MTSESLGIDLWDKLNSIITFNDNNGFSFDKLIRFTNEYCKSAANHNISQKKFIEKFVSDIQDLQKSDMTYSISIFNLVDRILEVSQADEIFNDTMARETEEVVKLKLSLIKRDSKELKVSKKKINDDLVKESHKLENSFKRYQNKYNAKQIAHSAYLKAEKNKALSRIQVENYHKSYNARLDEYNKGKEEYSKVLDEFNQFQSNYYTKTLRDWSKKVNEVEIERYNLLKTRFTNFSELCKSIATKFLDIAEKVEENMEVIDLENDLQLLISKEKTGDVPPQDVPFKDLDVIIGSTNGNSCDNSPVLPSTNNHLSGSDSNSTNSNSASNPQRKKSEPFNSLVSTMSRMRTSSTDNGPSNGSRVFSKLFGKRSKENTPEPTKETSSVINEQKPDTKEDNKEEYLDTSDLESIQSSQNSTKFINKRSATLNRSHLDTKPLSIVERNCSTMARNNNVSSSGGGGRSGNSNVHNIAESDDGEWDVSVKSDGKGEVAKESEVSKPTNKFGFRSRKSVTQESNQTTSTKNNWLRRRSQSVTTMIQEHLVAPIKKEFSESRRESRRRSSKYKVNGDDDNSKSKRTLGRRGSANERESIYNKSNIEVIRDSAICNGPVEIVSTPAEAMACLSNSNSRVVSSCANEEYEILPCDSISTDECASFIATQDKDDSGSQKTYYYVGSCVALHQYTTGDPSTIYLSFQPGDQFYIVQETVGDTNSSSESDQTGWLLVETIDRLKMGYVPDSYMDKRQFETPILMVSKVED